VRLVELLRHFTDDHRAGRVGQARELPQMFFELVSRAAALPRRADENRALDRRRE
jgi:hypothetical protein